MYVQKCNAASVIYKQILLQIYLIEAAHMLTHWSTDKQVAGLVSQLVALCAVSCSS